MQILFIWIKNFRSIHEQGFSFSCEYNFEFTYSEDEQKLTIRKNKNFIDGFYGKNISEFTAIIGENGSGKSTLLEFLVQFFTQAGSAPSDILWVHKENNSLYYHVGEHFDKIKIEAQGLKIKKNNTSQLQLHEEIIFYSNIYDGTKIYRNWHEDVFDISTNYLIRKGEKSEFSETENFRYEEIKRQIEFIKDYDGRLNEYFDFRPNELIIRFSAHERHEVPGKNYDKIAIEKLQKAFSKELQENDHQISEAKRRKSKKI